MVTNKYIDYIENLVRHTFQHNIEIESGIQWEDKLITLDSYSYINDILLLSDSEYADKTIGKYEFISPIEYLKRQIELIYMVEWNAKLNSMTMQPTIDASDEEKEAQTKEVIEEVTKQFMTDLGINEEEVKKVNEIIENTIKERLEGLDDKLNEEDITEAPQADLESDIAEAMDIDENDVTVRKEEEAIELNKPFELDTSILANFIGDTKEEEIEDSAKDDIDITEDEDEENDEEVVSLRTDLENVNADGTDIKIASEDDNSEEDIEKKKVEVEEQELSADEKMALWSDKDLFKRPKEKKKSHRKLENKPEEIKLEDSLVDDDVTDISSEDLIFGSKNEKVETSVAPKNTINENYEAEISDAIVKGVNTFIDRIRGIKYEE